MTPLRVLIVDDEPLARQAIRVLVARDAELSVLAECGDAETAVHAIRELRPDLVFLDISMPEANGFEVLEAASPHRPGVIFVTAYDQYAIDALRADAIDYLLKPFTDDSFFAALGRAKTRLAAGGGSSLRAAGAGIVIRTGARITVVPLTEISWIEAAGNYAALHTANKTHLLRQPMNDVEFELDPARFVRAHRSAILNVERIREVRPDTHGDAEAVLKDGSVVRVSRARRDAVEAALNRYLEKRR